MEGGFLPEPAEQQPAPAWQQQEPARRAAAPPPPPPPRFVAPPAALPKEHPEAHGGCSRCPSLTFNAEWLRTFGVVLCNQCRRGEQLISKVGHRRGAGTGRRAGGRAGLG